MDPQLLYTIVDTSKVNASQTNPHGYTYVPVDRNEALDVLVAGKMIQKGSTSADGQSWAVRPLEQAVKWYMEQQGQQSMPQAEVAQRMAAPPAPPAPPAQQPAPQHAPQPYAVKLEDNVPMPEVKRAFGGERGPSQVDLYPFGTMNVGQSFFLPQDNPPRTDEHGKIVPKHRSFSSVVSQANKKLEPKHFKIFEENNGARIYRMNDLTAPRPTRTRKTVPAVSQVQPGAPLASYPGGNFGGSVLGHPAAPPQPAPLPGFTAPQPGPGMFGPGPAPAWSPQDNPAPFAGPGFVNHGGAAAQAAGAPPAFQPPTDWGASGFSTSEE